MEVSEMLNKIFQGEVAAVHNYGAFVKLPGMGRLQGLVHKSQISSSRVDDATEVLEANEKVWFKVISVTDGGKVGLSMKVVDQGSGRDLDPNGVQLSLDAQQRKERLTHGESRAITLDAVYKTTCSRCGVLGHLSKNCFKTPDSKTYQLIPEPVAEKKLFGSVQDRLRRIADAGSSCAAVPTESAASTEPKEEKKQKKAKRKKISDSDSSDSKPKKRKKEKKHKKHKKHKRKKP